MTQTFPALVAGAAAENPGKPFLRCRSESGPVEISFAELEQRSRRVAAGLRNLGIGRGDRVAIAASNQAEWLEFFFGAAGIGAITVTLNVRYRENELSFMLAQSGARLVVSSATDGDTDLTAIYDKIKPGLPNLEHVFFLGAGDDWSRLTSSDGDGEPADVAPDDPAMILYTSGTTGTPKGATLTHGSIIGAARAQVQHFQVRHDDVYAAVMPLNHVGGITCTITAALLTRSTVALQAAFSPSKALEAIASNRATIFAGVPTMWTLMLADESRQRHDTSSLRLAVIGGANADPPLCAAICEAFPNARLHNLYGLSEVSGACVISPPDDDQATVARSIGVALPGVELRAVDADGREVEPGTDGELQVRGPGRAAGYWDNPEATAATFLPDGWVATGDMVTIEPDGHVVLRGRRKEMFVQGGYNVYPVEVENVLAAHPAVAMVAGIGVPDPVLGEVGQYHIVLKPGTTATEEELREFCAARLADYKVPRRIVFADELPLTPAGKIAKAKLRADAAGS